MIASRVSLGRLVFGAVLLASLGACSADNPDFVEPVCEPGVRSCTSLGTGQSAATVCGRDQDDRQVQLVDPCPTGSQCEAGRCTPGADLPACVRQATCAAGRSCAPLVADGAVRSVCVQNQAQGREGLVACQHDSDCASYRCLQHVGGRYCLLACDAPSDCGAQRTCAEFNVTIYGVQGTIRACTPA